MGTSATEDENFLNEVISKTLLDDSIDWIRENLKPEDVFEKNTLGDWAEENGYSNEGEE
jgi:hypothetical protein